MTEPSLATLDARIIAQRRLLARLVAALDPQTRQPLLDWLGDGQTMRDGQEDPGAVPAAGMAEALTDSDELRLILRLTQDHIHEAGQS